MSLNFLLDLITLLIFCYRDDKYRCQSVVDKFVGFAKQHGTRLQYKSALEMMLPTSALYDYLEGRLPHPSQTYPKIVEIVEAEEMERINKLIGERRTRLGAKIAQVTSNVKREVYGESKLEHLYACVIDWTHDDDMRRLYEERLLQRAYDTLAVLPLSEKAEKRAQVQKQAEGLVILKHSFALAWKIVLEWKDAESIADWDISLLRDYITILPEDGLAKVIKGFLTSEISPFPQETPAENEDPESDSNAPLTAEDRLILMTEGLDQSSRSILSQRLLSEYLLYLEEYSSSVESAHKCRELIELEKNVSGLRFQNNLDAIDLCLGTGLIHHQSPRNHSEARRIFDEILKRKPTNSSALIGVGLILEEEEEYDDAADFLSRALNQSPNIKVRAEAAWCNALKGRDQIALDELKQCLQALNEQENPSKELKSQILYRIGMCMWKLDTTKSGRKDRNGAYAQFLASLQANINYAPPYTSLGIYYADYGKDKKRARKCFQKAFELSASEVYAAERLARAFADQADWEMVEVVAQRVVESGKVRPPPGSKRKGLSWPFSALGVCQLNNQDYVKSTTSFQSALRISSEDYHCWVGLGESYHNSGRYIAATKAFEQARRLESQVGENYLEDTWFSRYMLANVRKELGDFDAAVDGYEAVLLMRQNELGVSVALLQTNVENAWHCIELGLFGRAASSSVKAIEVAQEILKHHSPIFNVWRAVGDACSMFCWMDSHVSEFPLTTIMAVFRSDAAEDMYSHLSEIDSIDFDTIESLSASDVSISTCVKTAILAHKRAIHTCSNDTHAQSVAWYNLGWIEQRASKFLAESSKKTNRYLRASVRCFKRAIELEAGNAEFWNSLGVVTTQLNPKVAQHAFVRSLFINDKLAKTWTNLGALYLIQNDTELANEAFTRGQSADPDYAYAWLGQGLLALLLGEAKEAYALFTHAFEIADSSSLIVKRLYASSTFDQILSSPNSAPGTSELLQPLFTLYQVKTQASSDMVFRHLSALLAERVGDRTQSIESLSSVCEAVEAEYEVTESPLSLARFAQAKSDLARAELASSEFALAAENAETALDLSADEDADPSHKEPRHKLCLSAHLTAGLAYHYLGSMDKAIAMFRTALEESHGDPDTVCILARVLWAKGSENEQMVAREQLFDCIEKHPNHAGAIILLAVIAVLDDDIETLEAVTDDLHGLRTRDDIGGGQKMQIGKLLATIAQLGAKDENSEVSERVEATAAVMLAPGEPHGWRQLADLSEAGDTHPAEMRVLAALNAVPPRGGLGAEDLARAYLGTERPVDVQKAIMIAPCLPEGWEGLL